MYPFRTVFVYNHGCERRQRSSHEYFRPDCDNLLIIEVHRSTQARLAEKGGRSATDIVRKGVIL
jgi:hypothetical protein